MKYIGMQPYNEVISGIKGMGVNNMNWKNKRGRYDSKTIRATLDLENNSCLSNSYESIRLNFQENVSTLSRVWYNISREKFDRLVLKH